MSMTGYGRSVVSVNNTSIFIELRTVNHRFLDISLKLPRSLMSLEDKIKKLVQANFSRGRIEVFVNMDDVGLNNQDVVVNWDLLDKYISSFKDIKEHYQLVGDVSLDMVSKLEGVYTIQENDHLDTSIHQEIFNGVTNACQQVVEMRETEGEALETDLVERNAFVRKLINQLGEQRETVIMEHRNRIKQRIDEYLTENLVSDDSKIYQDIALLAEKGDISEEVTRIHSHVSQFTETIKIQAPIGRKLDFIVQEMHREANTIGSKSNDVQISEIVVTLKSEIEKIKEQIQNIE